MSSPLQVRRLSRKRPRRSSGSDTGASDDEPPKKTQCLESEDDCESLDGLARLREGIFDCNEIPGNRRIFDRNIKRTLIMQWYDNPFFRVMPMTLSDDLNEVFNQARDCVIKSQQNSVPLRLGPGLDPLRKHPSSFIPPPMDKNMVVTIYEKKNERDRTLLHTYMALVLEDYSLKEAIVEIDDHRTSMDEYPDDIYVWIRRKYECECIRDIQGKDRKRIILNLELFWSVKTLWRHLLAKLNIEVRPNMHILIKWYFDMRDEPEEHEAAVKLDKWLKRGGSVRDFLLETFFDMWREGNQFPYHKLNVRLEVQGLRFGWSA